jgi:hypothetical protein
MIHLISIENSSQLLESSTVFYRIISKIADDSYFCHLQGELEAYETPGFGINVFKKDSYSNEELKEIFDKSPYIIFATFLAAKENIDLRVRSFNDFIESQYFLAFSIYDDAYGMILVKDDEMYQRVLDICKETKDIIISDIDVKQKYWEW